MFLVCRTIDKFLRSCTRLSKSRSFSCLAIFQVRRPASFLPFSRALPRRKEEENAQTNHFLLGFVSSTPFASMSAILNGKARRQGEVGAHKSARKFLEGSSRNQALASPINDFPRCRFHLMDDRRAKDWEPSTTQGYNDSIAIKCFCAMKRRETGLLYGHFFLLFLF